MSVVDIYAKMLQDPKNRVKTQIKQPTPFDDPQVKNVVNQKEQPKEEPEKLTEISGEDKAFLDDLDKRMALRAAGKKFPVQNNNRVKNLENRIKELEEAVKLVMDTHMKLISKLEKNQ